MKKTGGNSEPLYLNGCFGQHESFMSSSPSGGFGSCPAEG